MISKQLAAIKEWKRLKALKRITLSLCELTKRSDFEAGLGVHSHPLVQCVYLSQPPLVTLSPAHSLSEWAHAGE